MFKNVGQVSVESSIAKVPLHIAPDGRPIGSRSRTPPRQRQLVSWSGERMASISELLKKCDAETGPVAELVKALAKKVLELERRQAIATCQKNASARV
jgi:hypothetical protein